MKRGVAVFVFRRSALLVGIRLGSSGGDRMWQVPGGHLEQGETEADCGFRELKEETGLEAPTLVKIGDFQHGEYLVTVLTTQIDEGEPKNMEPTKCAGWIWSIPSMIPQNRFGILQQFDQIFDQTKKVLVASAHPQKQAVLNVFGQNTNIRVMQNTLGIPNQSMGAEEIYYAARHRLTALEFASSPGEVDYLVAFETGLVKFGPIWSDLTLVFVKDVKTGDTRMATSAGIGASMEAMEPLKKSYANDTCSWFTSEAFGCLHNVTQALSIAKASLNGPKIL